MLDAQDLQCLLCGGLFRAWHQVGVRSVMCPYCTTEVALDGRPIQPPARLRLRQWLSNALGAAVPLGSQVSH